MRGGMFHESSGREDMEPKKPLTPHELLLQEREALIKERDLLQDQVEAMDLDYIKGELIENDSKSYEVYRNFITETFREYYV